MFAYFVVPAFNHLLELQKKHPVAISQSALAAPEPKQDELPAVGEQNNEALTELIREKLDDFPKDQKWSVFLYDFKDGNSVEINPNMVLPAASLYKLFLLEALESKLPYDKWAYTWTSDWTNISQCVEEMLQKSDSPCAETLSNYIGWGVVNGLNRKNGFVHTSISGTDGRVTTVSDVGELLIRLQKGQILSDNARRFVFDTLYQQINNEGISKGCKDCRVADKIGEMNGVANDAGIITHGSRSYALVIMSEGGSLKQITELTKMIENQ